MNTTITIDKLILNLYYPLYEDLPRFLLQSNNSISTNEMTDIRDFKRAFIISYRGQEIGFLNTGFHLNSTLNQIVIFNELFYTSKPLLKRFVRALKCIDIKIDVSSIEVALDCDSDIHAKRYTSLMKSEKLVLAKNYISQFIKRDYINNKFIKNAPKTIYVKSNTKSKKSSLRFENKTAEILLKSSKYYITDYHSKMGLDTTKDIYRFELVIPNADSLNLSINPFYISNEDASKSITSYKRDVLVKTLDDMELRSKGCLVFEPNALKTRMTLDEYTSLRNVKTRYDIDITRLFDDDYLCIIFSTFGSSIIQNLKAILKNNIYTNEILKTKKISMETREKRQTKLIVNHKIGMADHLSKERNISFDEALRWVTEFVMGVEQYDIDVTDLSRFLETK